MKFIPGPFGHFPEWQARRPARRPRRPAVRAARGGGGRGEVRVRHLRAAEAPLRDPAGRIEIETADAADTVVDVEAIRGDLDDLKVEQHGRDIVIETRKKFGRGTTSSPSASARPTARTSTRTSLPPTSASPAGSARSR